MSAQVVSEFINQLKAALWATSDEELAAKLGIGKSTIASWRRRGSVPDKIQREIYFQYNVDYCLIETGKPCILEQSNRLFGTALYAAIMKIGKELDEHEIQDAAAWISAHEIEFRAHIVDRAVFNIPDPFNVEAYARVLADVLTGDLATVAAFEKLKADVAEREGEAEDDTEYPT